MTAPITLEEAERLVFSQVPPPERSEVALTDAQGCVLAADVACDIDLPPFDRAMMDGFAIVAGDTGRLRIVENVPAGVAPMCGNSICQDRRFLARWMPKLEAYCHYRNLDVSTLKELVKRWKPAEIKEMMKLKQGKHEALADIYESIEELKYYRKSVMTI